MGVAFSSGMESLPSPASMRRPADKILPSRETVISPSALMGKSKGSKSLKTSLARPKAAGTNPPALACKVAVLAPLSNRPSSAMSSLASPVNNCALNIPLAPCSSLVMTKFASGADHVTPLIISTISNRAFVMAKRVRYAKRGSAPSSDVRAAKIGSMIGLSGTAVTSSSSSNLSNWICTPVPSRRIRRAFTLKNSTFCGTSSP